MLETQQRNILFFAGIIFARVCDSWQMTASQAVIKKKKKPRSSKENILRKTFLCFKFLE